MASPELSTEIAVESQGDLGEKMKKLIWSAAIACGSLSFGLPFVSPTMDPLVMSIIGAELLVVLTAINGHVLSWIRSPVRFLVAFAVDVAALAFHWLMWYAEF